MGDCSDMNLSFLVGERQNSQPSSFRHRAAKGQAGRHGDTHRTPHAATAVDGEAATDPLRPLPHSDKAEMVWFMPFFKHLAGNPHTVVTDFHRKMAGAEANR